MIPKTNLSDNRLENQFKDAKPFYNESEARIEANRCLFCFDAPCVKACPTEIDIPGFIRKIASGNIRGSATTILRSNLMGVSTARVCPVEELCAGACVYNDYDHRPINIGRLQRYATEKALQLEQSSGRPLFSPKPSLNRSVALIGAGPASLACAAYLALEGVRTIIYEKSNLPGGLNTAGIAPYKLKATDAFDEIDWLMQFGLEVKTGLEIGRDITLDQLLEEHEAVFLGVGLGNDKPLGIPGEDEAGVWGATQLIRKIKEEKDFKLPRELRRAVVIGGGNTAIDIARELSMLGVPEVDILYRRTTREMPGYAHELEAARKYGVRLIERIKPVEICRSSSGQLNLLGESVDSGESVEFPCDWIVIAIGQEKLAPELIPGLEVDLKGCVIVDSETRNTSIPNIYAGGDCINGGKEVVNAVADGREAAFAMLRAWGLNPEIFSLKIGSNING